MKTLHQELSEIANTPQLDHIAHELKITHTHLKRNLEVLANFESRQKKYQELLRGRVTNIPEEFFFSEADYVIKSQTIDEIIKLIEKI